MHRTQILIEEWQYEALRGRAERERCSRSALIREILNASLNPSEIIPRKRLQTIEGIGEDAVASGQEHDKYLYAGK